MNKKLVFFDVDGTLLNDHKTINKSTIDAIEKLKDKGFIFCIATGRGLSEGILEIAKIAGLNGYLILANGNFVWDINNETLSLIGRPIDSTVINAFYKAAVTSKRELNLFFNDGSIKAYYFGENVNDEVHDPNFYISGPSTYVYNNNDEVKADLDKSIVHISLKAEHEVIKKYYPILKAFETDKLAQISNVSNVYVEAESFGISKWTGVQFIQKKLNVANEDTYAIGDSLNDLILLTNVTNSVCMGNGSDEVKKIAKTVIGSNNTDAIGTYLNSLVENEK